jgi:membrane protein DedA with SNARE-associated domain
LEEWADFMLNLPAAAEGTPVLIMAWFIVFVMNAVTFPLPPAWMVLATFREYTHVALLPLTICGSAAAALGRLLFAWQVKTFTHRLPADARTNADALAAAAHSRLRWPWLFVVIYSLLPISSDAVFTAVGMGALPLRSTLVAFFLARSVFNTLMVLTAAPVVSNLAELFAGRFGWRSIAIVLLATAGYALFLKLPWAQWLRVQPAAQKIRPSINEGAQAS